MPLHYTRLLTGLSLVDVLLRVPPLFIIDELFRLGLGLPQSGLDEYLLETNGSAIASDDELPTVASHIFHYDADFYKLLFIVLLRIVASCVCCLAALITFLLWTKHLLIVYTYAISVAVIFFSYWGNVMTVKTVLEATGPGRPSPIEDFLAFNVSRLFSNDGLILIENYFAQIALAAVFSHIHLGPRHAILQKLWPISFTAPTLLCLLPLSPSFLSHAPVFAAVLPLVMVKFILWSSVLTIVNLLCDGYGHAHNFISNFGLTTLVENEWNRLNVPSVLRTFWVLRLLEQAVAMQLLSFEFNLSNLLLLGKTLLISGGETLTAVLGMTSVISYGCHYIGCFFQWVLLIDDEDDQSIGTVSAILFYILALQTGLTGLEPEKRFVRLCRNFCLLFTALLHFIHNIVNPLLMSLSASHNPALHRHIRALLVCLFLIIYPVGLLFYLWTNHPMSTWLLAVSAFSVEVIVKVIVSLLIYTLFLIDAYRSTFWEKLDDYVYYIRVLGNSVEFCFGIFLFFNGAWILVFESGGAIRAGMMGIHAYFNIWCEARSGWLVFMKRRTAVNKIESLPEASESQLAQLDDVCAICYQEMRTAKITRCNHYFHGVCLRKWLYVQDRCPLCHDILYKVEVEKENEPSS